MKRVREWWQRRAVAAHNSMTKAARNERRKLTATYLNNLAVALFAIGVITPIAAYVYSLAPGERPAFVTAIPLRQVFWGLYCFGASVALHSAARIVLRECEE